MYLCCCHLYAGVFSVTTKPVGNGSMQVLVVVSIFMAVSDGTVAMCACVVKWKLNTIHTTVYIFQFSLPELWAGPPTWRIFSLQSWCIPYSLLKDQVPVTDVSLYLKPLVFNSRSLAWIRKWSRVLLLWWLKGKRAVLAVGTCTGSNLAFKNGILMGKVDFFSGELNLLY